MMNRIAVRILPWAVGALFLYISFYMMFLSDEWPKSVRYLPIGIGFFGLIISCMELITPHVAWLRKHFNPSAILDLGLDVSDDQIGNGPNIAFAWFFGLIAAIILIGFHLAFPLFMLVYLVRYTSMKWWKIVIYLVVIYAIFFIILDSFMYIPWLDPLLF